MEFKFNIGDKVILQEPKRFPSPIEVEVAECHLTADGHVYFVKWHPTDTQTSGAKVPESALKLI